MKKMKSFLYLALVVLGLALAAPPAPAQSLQWSSPAKYDDGHEGSLAMHPSGLVLDFHQTHAPLGITLWYHVGKVDGASVTWGGSQQLPASGYWPNVAITKAGYVLFVWSTGEYKSSSDLSYMVGKIDPNGGVNQSITWLTEKKGWDSGFHSSIAMNDNGIIVGVHESGSGGVGLYYRVGHFANPAGGDFNIIWDSGNYGRHYDDGINPHIALNNRNEVVEVHQVTGEYLLHYHRGVVVSGGVIDFRPSQRYDDNGGEPSVALRDDGLVVEIHRNGDDASAYARTGEPNPANPNLLNWSSSAKVSPNNDHGKARYPAVTLNENYAVASWTNSDSLINGLYSAVAKLP